MHRFQYLKKNCFRDSNYTLGCLGRSKGGDHACLHVQDYEATNFHAMHQRKREAGARAAPNASMHVKS
jgi:hypothetical protein